MVFYHNGFSGVRNNFILYQEGEKAKMKKVLLPETKIGEHLAVGCELEGDDIGLFIASLDVSASCAFKVKEWNKFVEAVFTANASLELA